MSNSPFRKAVDALLKGNTTAAHKLLRKSQPLSPSQSRIWERICQRVQ